MSQERMEILKMVADKVITVDEAERLLRALEDGNKRRREGPGGGPGRRHGFGAALEDLGEMLGGLGPTLRNAFQDAMAGAGLEIPDDDGPPGGPVEERRFTLEKGTEVVVRDMRGPLPSGEEVVLEGGPGDACELSGDGAAEARVFRRPGRVVVHGGKGPLRLLVPDTVERVKVMTLGGNVRVHGVKGALAVRSMGGGVVVEGATAETKVWTAGGDVDVALAAAWSGDSSVVSPGGSITLRVRVGTAGKVRASSVGGSIDVDQELGTVRRQRVVAKDRVDLELGGVASGSTFTLKTMGGNVRVKRA